MTRCIALLLLLAGALGLALTPLRADDDDHIRADRLGIAHISTASDLTPIERYQQALLLGAGWNRWPLYWNWVQPAANVWDWTDYDRQVRYDLAHGLQINAILLGIPDFYGDGDSIQGLHEPIFFDGTDDPAPGKAINPANPWARFVYAAVNRYQPGGELAAEADLPPGAGIRVWEVWNEPDLEDFWRGGVQDYARMLKVAYITVKQADPQAQVMFGGLLYPTQRNFMARVLNIFANDPQADDFNWYFDIAAVHSYADPWRSGWLVLYVRQTMIEFGLRRPIWLNETGVPVWDDYPGPVWQPLSPARASSEQQAHYLIQSAVYAWAEGAEKVFFHQLYDDCGDQPAGTDFPVHNGELCDPTDATVLCAGDAHGMFRNVTGSVCFSQHPAPGTPRPVTRAYRLLAEVFGREPFEAARRQPFIEDRFATFVFERPHSGQRITVMWNRSVRPGTLRLPAAGQNGQLISLDGQFLALPDIDGAYSIPLPPADPQQVPTRQAVTAATSDDNDNGEAAESVPGWLPIGGAPYILIEQVGGQVTPISVNLDVLDVPPPAAVIADAPTQPPPRPTTDPALDTRPPIASVLELPAISEPTFTVSWRGIDDSGIAGYLIWVRVDGGDWQPWLETPPDAVELQTSAIYTGTPGSTYDFAAWAVDLAGNWSENVNLRPQATTRIRE